jgi:hypothetical protein
MEKFDIPLFSVSAGKFLNEIHSSKRHLKNTVKYLQMSNIR